MKHKMTNIIPASVDDDHHDHGFMSDTYDNNNNNPKDTNYYSYRISNIDISSGSVRRVLKRTIFVAAFALGCVVLMSSFGSPFPLFLQTFYYNYQVKNEPLTLEAILERGSMKDERNNKTVIMTILNDAWAEPHSVFDLFLESFRIGNGTAELVKHLVVICMDDKAYARCTATHPHCYQLHTIGANFTNEAFFMSQSYLKMVGRKIDFLSEVLQLGYSFVFSDNDIMWLRNPFQRFSEEDDFQVSCDNFNGNSSDRRNFPNTGFMYVRSNPRTIEFYKFWNSSIRAYKRSHDQDVLNRIKFHPYINKIGVKIRFFDTVYFGGFCQPSKDINLVCTMHANCCVGLKNKVNDLTALLEDWKRFKSSGTILNPRYPWSVPIKCGIKKKH